MANDLIRPSAFVSLSVGVLIGGGLIWIISNWSPPQDDAKNNVSGAPPPAIASNHIIDARENAAFEAAARANKLAAARLTNSELTGSSTAIATWSPPYSNVVCGSSPVGQWVVQTNEYGAVRYESSQIGFWKIWQIDQCPDYAPVKQAALEAENLYQRTHPINTDCFLARLKDFSSAKDEATRKAFNRKHHDPHECNEK